mgnify:CR=1 FL=1
MDKINNIPNRSIFKFLNKYTSTYEEESIYKDMMIDFLDHFGGESYERRNPFGHFTASAWIITDDNKRALITHHKKLGLKLQLGGHCDGDNNILRVAIKEAIEES